MISKLLPYQKKCKISLWQQNSWLAYYLFTFISSSLTLRSPIQDKRKKDCFNFYPLLRSASILEATLKEKCLCFFNLGLGDSVEIIMALQGRSLMVRSSGIPTQATLKEKYHTCINKNKVEQNRSNIIIILANQIGWLR